jgi:hypothetical protein
VWFKLLRRCNLHHLAPGTNDRFVDWWLQSRKCVPKVKCKAFDSFFIVMKWNLWLERNFRIFKSVSTPPTLLIHVIWVRCELWCRAKLVDRLVLIGM